MRILLVSPIGCILPQQPWPRVMRSHDVVDFFIDVPAETLTSEIEKTGAHLKAAFDYAREEHYELVVLWNRKDWDAAPAVEDLLRVLSSRPDAAGAFVLNASGVMSKLQSELISIVSGHSFKGWFSIARAYRTEALSKIVYELNTYEAHFEIEVVLQLLSQRATVLPVHCEPSRHYSLTRHSMFFQSLKAAIKYRLQSINLFYDFRFHPEDVFPQQKEQAKIGPYRQKFHADSPHQKAVELISPGSRVLDIGCASGYVAKRLVEEKKCSVVGVDQLPSASVSAGWLDYHQMNLEKDQEQLIALIQNGNFDVILLLDVLEHLALPELFLLRLYRCAAMRNSVLIASTGNVAFIVVRLMLFLGYFNYGNRGILDVTHKRLFSVQTFKNLLDQTGFLIYEKYFFPIPFQELGFSMRISLLLERVNRLFLRIRPSLFAYQMLFVAHSTKRFQHSGPVSPRSALRVPMQVMARD